MKLRSAVMIDLGFTETPTALPSGLQLGTPVVLGSAESGGEGEFLVGQANGVVTQYYACGVRSGATPFDFTHLVQADAADYDPLVAIAVNTMADNDYGLFCVRHHDGVTYADGTSNQGMSLFTAAGSAKDSRMYVSGTTGVLTTTGTTTQVVAEGIRLRTATGTAAAANNATADYPRGIRFGA